MSNDVVISVSLHLSMSDGKQECGGYVCVCVCVCGAGGWGVESRGGTRQLGRGERKDVARICGEEVEEGCHDEAEG